MPIDHFFAVTGPAASEARASASFWADGVSLFVEGRRAFLAVGDDYIVVFVGRIDNTAEARGALRIDHETAADAAALFLAAWRRWGTKAVDTIVGSYAGVVFDRCQGSLTTFRDLTAGVSVYLTVVPGGHLAGSDLGRVATWAGRRVEPDPLFIASYLQNSFFDATVTAFAGVAALAPGHIGIAEGSAWHQRQAAFWHVRDISYPHFVDYVDAFAELFDEAVRCRLEGHRRVGVSLSGGMDSTNVLASGIRVAPEVEWVSYAIPFDDADGDERRLQRLVAEHCHSELRWVPVRGRGPLGDWTGMLFAGRPAPPTGGNWFFAESVAEAATCDGSGVVYDGEDADSLLAISNGHLPDLFVRGRWRTWWHEVKRLERREAISWKAVLHFSVRAQLPPAWAHRMAGRPAVARVSSLVSPQLAARVSLSDRLMRQPPMTIWSPGRRYRAERLLVGAPPYLSDVATSLGTAYRDTPTIDAHPFQDRRLMTFCMGVPWRILRGDGRGKPLMRALSDRRLPKGFNDVVRKAKLQAYYDAAVFEHEKPTVMRGLDLAAKRPDLVNQEELLSLRHAVENRTDSWMASRVAMLMFWIDQLQPD